MTNTNSTATYPVKGATRALTILTILNYLNFIDRYVLAALIPAIKSDLGLSDLEAGSLMTAFLVPHVFSTPIFGWLGDTRSRAKIIALGAAVWSVASILTGQAPTFAILLLARALLGIGESAFTVVSIPFLYDHYPKEKRGRTMAIFMSAISLGVSLGIILGGIIGKEWGWRSAFFIVGVPGLILALMTWFLPEPKKTEMVGRFDAKKILSELTANRLFLMGTIGYIAYVFSAAGGGYWGPTFLQRTHGLELDKAGELYGSIMMTTGIAGTIIGGLLGDRLAKKVPHGQLYVCAWSMIIGAPFLVAALYTADLQKYIVFMSIATFLGFMPTSPFMVSCLGAVPGALRASATAAVIFTCHILGDAISVPLIGVMSDKIGSLQMAIIIAAGPTMFLAGIIWLLGTRTKFVHLD